MLVHSVPYGIIERKPKIYKQKNRWFYEAYNLMLLKYTTEGEHNIHCNIYQNPSKIDLKMLEIHTNFHRNLNSPNSTKQEKKLEASSLLIYNPVKVMKTV